MKMDNKYVGMFSTIVRKHNHALSRLSKTHSISKFSVTVILSIPLSQVELLLLQLRNRQGQSQ